MMSIKQEAECDIIDSQIYKFPGRSKSSVWNHFGFQKGVDGELDKSRAVCKICRHGIRYSGNTTNLHCHLTKHRRQNLSLFAGLDESWMHASLDSKYDFKFCDSVVQSTVEDMKTGNIVQPSTSTSDENKSCQRSKHQQLNDTIVNVFIEHLLPLSVVESTSFYSMVAVADPMYVIPDRDILFGNLIQQTFNETKKSIDAEISGNELITLVELWESINGDKFVSILCQLINSLWQMKTFLLKTISLNDIPNDDAFPSVLKSVFDEWGIKSPVALINDGSEIIQKTFASINLVNMPCCRKILFTAGDNLMKNENVTKSVIEFIILLIGRVLQHKSPQSLYETIFEIIKDHKEIEAKTFPWTTFTSVLQCAMQNKELVKNSVFQNENRSDEMWQQISDMAAVLAPLLKAYDLLIDKSSVISSMILPVLRKLEMELTSQTEDSEFSKVLKRATWLSISEPFHSTTVRNFLLISSLLDPRYKELQFVEAPEKLRAREMIGTIATEMYRDRKGQQALKENCVYEGEVIVVEESGDVIRIEPMEKRQKLNNHEYSNVTDDWLADVVCKDRQSEQVGEKEEKVMIEIDHYISTAQVNTLPLQWWSHREGLYPTLSRLARRYLCMHNFRISDNKTIRNAQLSAQTVDKLLILHHHYYCQ